MTKWLVDLKTIAVAPAVIQGNDPDVDGMGVEVERAPSWCLESLRGLSKPPVRNKWMWYTARTVTGTRNTAATMPKIVSSGRAGRL